MSELSAPERIVLAVTSNSQYEAEHAVAVAQRVGARYVKLGSALAAATSWRYCSELAGAHKVEWIADTKTYDGLDEVGGTAEAVANLNHRPFALTVHAAAGNKAMRIAQSKAGDVNVLGVTGMPPMTPSEAEKLYGASPEYKNMAMAQAAARAGLRGLMVPPNELWVLKRDPQTYDLLTLVDGAYSNDVENRALPFNVYTPEDVMREGADLVVVGGQITQATDPARAFQVVAAEVERGLAARQV